MLAFLFVTSQSRKLPLWGIKKDSNLLDDLNIKKFKEDYKNKLIPSVLNYYVANKKLRFYLHAY